MANKTEDSLEADIDKKVRAMLKAKDPNKDTMQALALAIKWVAVKRRLDDGEWASALLADETKEGE